MELNKAQVIVTGGGFELSDLLTKDVFSRATHRVPFVKDAAGNDLLGVIIVGKNSEEYQANKNQSRIENIMRAAKRTAAVDTKTEEGAALINTTVSDNDHAKAVAVCVDWFGFNDEGQPATFTKERIDQVLAKMPAWEELVVNAIETDANFMKV